ncbi:MAG: CerR family C-terminal domain-containing protein [Nitrospira sp.]|nr:CerR family C-terminal domain-containing protein [Nitrospira sp.]
MPLARQSNASRASRADGAATYQRILETAGKLFAASGFAETSSKAIATQAGADLASINYHFGSRGGLYQAVLAEAHRRFISLEALQKLSAANLPARDKLQKAIEQLLGGAAGHRGWHAKVLGRELLSPTSHLQVLRQQEIFPKVRIIMSILSDITSIPPNAPALARCAMSIAAPCAAMLIVGNRMPAISGKVLETSQEVLASHLYHFAIGGLDAIAREHAKTARVKKRPTPTRASKKPTTPKP